MNSDPLAIVLDMLADRIAARIGSVREREVFTSVDLPPHVTRRRYAELCRSGRIAGATRDGAIWTCTRAAWEASRRRAAKVTAPARELAAPELEAEATELLASAGLRVMRGGR
jgi:hypothetical protein